ncbi:MAG TPA: hypothetical protein VF370_00420 [Candidatus Cryosericum sp.]
MAERKGKDLEILVAQLESALAGENVVITSNEEIADVVTGEPREVDVAVRTGVGSSQLLIIVECRDRKGRQDVTWIEGLAAKRTSVGADKAVAVSRNGLSDPALLKAKALGIAVASIEDISLDDIKSWCKLDGLTTQQYAVRFKEFYADLGLLAEQSGSLHNPVIVRKVSGDRCSMADVWNSMLETLKAQGDDLYDGLAPDGPHREAQVQVTYANPADCYQIEVGGQMVDVKQFRVDAEFWLQNVVVPPTRVFTYGQNGGPAVDVLEFDQVPGLGPEPMGLRIQRNAVTGIVSVVPVRSKTSDQ